MNLIEFKNHIESFPQGTVFKYGISRPFSWRGSYNEVAFAIEQEPSTREEILENIQLALTETFYGYKGGEFNYYDRTPINFENACGSWTAGGYCSEMIAIVENSKPYRSQEERLVKLAFREE